MRLAPGRSAAKGPPRFRPVHLTAIPLPISEPTTYGSRGPQTARRSMPLSLGCPRQQLTIEALGLSSKTTPGRIAKVEVSGVRQAPVWKQTENGQAITVPESSVGIPEYGVDLKAYLA